MPRWMDGIKIGSKDTCGCGAETFEYKARIIDYFTLNYVLSIETASKVSSFHV